MRLRTEGEVRQLRERRHDPAFSEAWKGLVTRADDAVAQALQPVSERAGWGHGYFCPEHVVPLEFDARRPERHRCAVGGEEYTGAEFDGGWRCVLNAHVAGGLSATALAWLATGEDRYLDHVRGILRRYALLYPTLPSGGIHVGAGRVTGQSLEEAVWSITIAQVYDDVRSGLSVADQELIERDLLRQVGEQVQGQLLHKIHNIECWHLASLATIGAVLSDGGLLGVATVGEHALPAQLEEGILADGWWAEGSPGYHFYMAMSVLRAALALRAVGSDLLDRSRFRQMFYTPLTILRSDLSFPALNDGWLRIAEPLGITQYVSVYEQAWGLWKDPALAAFLREVYDHGVPRDSDAALTMGPNLAGVQGNQPRPVDRVHRASGYAVLADDDRFLLGKFGLHGGGHGHPDKLQLDLFAFGVRLAPDAGSPAYNSPLQMPWYRQTLAHNTALIAERSQPEAEGRLLGFVDPESTGLGLIDMAVSWPTDPDAPNGRPGAWLREPRRVHVPEYAGASMRRVVLWKAPYFIDVVVVDAVRDQPVDLAWHHRGSLLSPRELELADWKPPADSPYEFLDDVRAVPGARWRLEWEVDGAGTRMWGCDPVGGTTLVATSPSNPPAERQSTLLRRARGSRVCYAAVIEPVRDGGCVTAVHWSKVSPDLWVALTVELSDGADEWRLSTGAEARIGRTGAIIDATVLK